MSGLLNIKGFPIKKDVTSHLTDSYESSIQRNINLTELINRTIWSFI